MYKRYIFIASLCLHACLFSANYNPSELKFDEADLARLLQQIAQNVATQERLYRRNQCHSLRTRQPERPNMIQPVTIQEHDWQNLPQVSKRPHTDPTRKIIQSTTQTILVQPPASSNLLEASRRPRVYPNSMVTQRTFHTALLATFAQRSAAQQRVAQSTYYAPSALCYQMNPAIVCMSASPSVSTHSSPSTPSTPSTKACDISQELTPAARPNDGRIWRYNPYNPHNAIEFEKKP